jgi:hypothetical protein
MTHHSKAHYLPDDRPSPKFPNESPNPPLLISLHASNDASTRPEQLQLDQYRTNLTIIAPPTIKLPAPSPQQRTLAKGKKLMSQRTSYRQARKEKHPYKHPNSQILGGASEQSSKPSLPKSGSDPSKAKSHLKTKGTPKALKLAIEAAGHTNALSYSL